MINWKAIAATIFACATVTAAHADLVPQYESAVLVASVQFGTRASVAVQQKDFVQGQQSPLYAFSREIYQLRPQVALALHEYISAEASSIGAQAWQGQLSGTWSAMIRSVSADTNRIELSGLSYGANFRVSRYGVSCEGRVSFNNILVAAEFNVNTAVVNPLTSVVNLNPSQDISSCDTAISWIPGIGLLVDYVVEQFAERLLQGTLSGLAEGALSKVVGGVNGQLAKVAQLFDPAAPLWNGDPYAPKVREYLANNARYLLTGRSISLVMEPEPTASVVLAGAGDMMHEGVNKSADVFRLTFLENDRPLLLLSLRNNVHFAYKWVCSAANPRKKCHVDY